MSGNARSGPLPWALIMGGLLAVALLAGVVYFPVRIALDTDARDGQLHGTLTTSFCRYTGRSNSVAHCVGDFHSDDGALTVPDVTFSKVVRQELGYREQVPGWLADAGDRTAEVDDDARTERWVMLVLDAVLFAWLIAQVVWLVRETRRRRRHRSGADPRPS